MKIADDELDALRELINIGVGRAAGALNDMIGRTVQLNVPAVILVEPEQIAGILIGEHGRRLACVRLRFDGALKGVADLIFPSESGSKLVALLTGEDPQTPELDSLCVGTLTEVGNILLNGLMGSLTNVVQEHLVYGLPLYMEESADNLESSLRATPDGAVLLARAQFFVGNGNFELTGERIDGEITLLLGVDSLQHLVERVQQLGEEALA